MMPACECGILAAALPGERCITAMSGIGEMVCASCRQGTYGILYEHHSSFRECRAHTSPRHHGRWESNVQVHPVVMVQSGLLVRGGTTHGSGPGA